MPTSLRDALTRLPKVELHVHLEGTMLAETLIEMALKNGVRAPGCTAVVDETFDPTELYHYENLSGFLDMFWFVQSVLCTSEDWAMLAYESVLQAAANGVVYNEVFFTPARHLLNGMSLGAIIGGIDDGMKAGERETGTVSRLIYDIDREFGPAAATEQLGLLLDLRRSGARGSDRIIGIGMDSTELGVDPASFRAAYGLAARAGLHRTAHQGEASPSSAVATALDVLGCERIDHGISVLADPALVERVVAEQIPFTVCPSANVRINPDTCAGLASHPFPTMRDAGILTTLNTDDPALTGLSLGIEYTNVANAYGYDWPTMVQIAHAGVTAAWLADDDKSRLHAMIDVAGATTVGVLAS